jgi:hypothetical protein
MPFDKYGKWIGDPSFQADKVVVPSPMNTHPSSSSFSAPPTVGNSKYKPDPTSPGSQVKRPMSTPSRLIIPFETYKSSGVTGEFRANIPPQLLNLGINQSDWLSFLSKLEHVNKSRQGTPIIDFFLVLLIITSPIVVSHFLDYQKSLGQVIDEFNRTVLRPHNLFAKFQSNEMHGEHSSEVLSWLAISLTPQDAIDLERDSAFYTPKVCSKEMQPNNCKQNCCGTCCGVKIVIAMSR